MSQSIATLVKCARRHRNAGPGQCQESPLPVVEEPFGLIATNTVGPLPKSHLGKRYVLVICDYATRYPKAVALRCTDAEHITEELATVFFASWCPPQNSNRSRKQFHVTTPHRIVPSATCASKCALPPTIRKQTALSSGLTKPSKRCYERLHRPKGRTGTNSFHSCYLHIRRYPRPPCTFGHPGSLGKLQRRMMTVLYRTYCLYGRSCRKCLSWLVATCR